MKHYQTREKENRKDEHPTIITNSSMYPSSKTKQLRSLKSIKRESIPKREKKFKKKRKEIQNGLKEDERPITDST